MANPASSASRSEADPAAGTHGSAKPAGEVIAVTVRDDFLLELGEALGGQAAVHPVDSFPAAVERMSAARRAQLLVIDSRDTADLRGDVERAHAQVPHVPVIVFAGSDSEKTVAGALKSSNVFAVLPIPVDRRKTAAIVEGALADATAKRSAGRGTPSPSEPRSAHAEEIRFEARPPLTPEPASLAAEPPHDASEPPSGAPKRIVIAAAVAVAGVAAGAYWLFSHGASHAPATARHAAKAHAAAAASAAPAAEAPQITLVQGTLDSLLEKARLAMRERRYTEPAANCALLYYRSALGVDPTNGEARDGMRRLATLLESRFDEALTGGRVDEAAGALANLKVAAPGDAQLGALQARLLAAEIGQAFSSDNVERATALIRQAQQSSAFPPAQLAKWHAELAKHENENRAQHLADLFTARIRDGRLVEPASDSAKYYLQQLKQVAPADPVAQHGARDLIAACLRKARDAAVAGNPGKAAQWVAEARTAGMTSADYSAYQRDVASARKLAAAAQTDRLVQLARARMQDGHLTDPADDSAVYYLTQLERARPGDPDVTSVGRELATRLLERASAAARAGRADAMNSDLALARQWGADPALVQAVRDVLTGRSPAPAPAAEPEQHAAIPAGFVPQRTHYVAPQYPEFALDAHISGSVTVEFTVDVRGRPRDVRVVESTPRGTFDRAAIEAVSRWRYRPAVFDGVATAIPVRMVMRFKAPN